MENSKARIYVRRGEKGLDVYLSVNGTDHYLVTRRQNDFIWKKLNIGVTLGELKRIKPTKYKSGQRYYHSICHMLKIADYFIRYELAA
jgi:hypothetical protein